MNEWKTLETVDSAPSDEWKSRFCEDGLAVKLLKRLNGLGIPQDEVLADLYRYCRPVNQEALAALRDACAESARSAATDERKRYYKRGASAKGDGRDEFLLAQLFNRMIEATDGQYPSPWRDLTCLVIAGYFAFGISFGANKEVKDNIEKRVKRWIARFPLLQHPHHDWPDGWCGPMLEEDFEARRPENFFDCCP